KELMVRDLRQAIEDTQLKLWEMPVNQVNGIHMDLAWMPAQMPFNTVKDYDNYIERLDAAPRALSQTIDVMRLGMRDRLMPPRYLLEKVGEQVQNIANDAPERSPFAKPLAKFPAGIGEADRQR